MKQTEKRRAELRAALERAARSGGLTRSAARSVAADVCRLDETGGDQGVKEMLAELSDRDHDRVRRLVAALRRLDYGEYGRCDKCGGPIGDARLDVMPEVTTCRDCAE